MPMGGSYVVSFHYAAHQADKIAHILLLIAVLALVHAREGTFAEQMQDPVVVHLARRPGLAQLDVRHVRLDHTHPLEISC